LSEDAGMVPTLLLSLLHQQLFASVAYTASLQVVQAGGGAASKACWEPVRQVRGAVAECMQVTLMLGCAIVCCCQRALCCVLLRKAAMW
jgi:hypothetical protein